MEEKKNFSEFAIASLAIGLLTFIQLLAIEKAFCAIVLGLIALKRITENAEVKGRGLAMAGIALGIGYILLLSLIIGMNPGIFAKIQAALSSAK